MGANIKKISKLSLNLVVAPSNYFCLHIPFFIEIYFVIFLILKFTIKNKDQFVNYAVVCVVVFWIYIFEEIRHLQYNGKKKTPGIFEIKK